MTVVNIGARGCIMLEAMVIRPLMGANFHRLSFTSPPETLACEVPSKAAFTQRRRVHNTPVMLFGRHGGASAFKKRDKATQLRAFQKKGKMKGKTTDRIGKLVTVQMMRNEERKRKEIAFKRDGDAAVTVPLEDEDSEKFSGFVEDLLSPISQAELPGWPDLRHMDPDGLWRKIRYMRDSTLKPTKNYQDVEKCKKKLLKQYTSLIRILSAHDRFSEAHKEVLSEIRSSELSPDERVYTSLIHGAALAGKGSVVDELWRELKLTVVKPSPHSWAALMLAYCRCGHLDAALSRKHAMRGEGLELDLVHYTTLLSGLVNEGRVDEAWELYLEMYQVNDLDPDVMTYTIMMKACAKRAEFERAMGLMDEMEAKQIVPTRHTFHGLLRAASRAPLWIKAYGGVVDSLVQKMQGYSIPKNETTFRLLLGCYGAHGDADGVNTILRELEQWEERRRRRTSPRTYLRNCDTDKAIILAWAGCMSVGEVLGSKPRYGCLPQHIEADEKLKNEYRTVYVSRNACEELEELRVMSISSGDSSMDHQLKSKESRSRGATRQDYKDSDNLLEPYPEELDSIAESIIKREEIARLRDDDERDRLLGAELGIPSDWEYSEELLNRGRNWTEQHMIEDPPMNQEEVNHLLPLYPSKGNLQAEEEINDLLQEGKLHAKPWTESKSETELIVGADASNQVLGPTGLVDRFILFFDLALS